MLPILDTNHTNPFHDSSNPSWASQVCQNQTFLDNSNPVWEWTPVGNPTSELNGDVGISGTALVEGNGLSGTNMNDFRADVPFQHPFYNDWEFYIAPDQQYTSLLAPTNTGKDPNTGLIVDATYNRVTTTAAARGLAVPQGVLGVETDQGLVPPEYRALDGDRVVVLGRWIVDCGHPEFHTEIHPPLLLAVARPIGNETSVKVIGRPFLVSQDFGDGALRQHFLNEVSKVETIIQSSRIEAHPRIISPPFSGIRIMTFYVRPPTPRQSPNDKLSLSFHFTVRNGVAIEVTKGLNPDEVQVIVTMNDVNYQPATPPPMHHVTVQISDLPSKVQALAGVLGFLNPIVAPIIAEGILTDRYDLPSPQSVHDSENVVTNVDVAQMAGNSTVSVDDNQPYPIYGWLTLQWTIGALNTDVAPAAAAAGDYVFFFAKHPDGRIFYNRAKLGQGGEGWVEVGGGGRTNASPAAAAVGTYMFLAVRGLDGNIYINQTGDLGQSFTGWSSANFNTDVAPAVAAAGDYVFFFAKHPDGRIFYNRAKLGQGGEGWVEVGGGGRTNASPAAAAVGTYMFIAVRGLDGNIYINQTGDLGQSFTGWSSANFNTDVAPAVAAAGDYVFFFAKHPDGRIFYNRAKLGQGGEGWVEVGGGGRTNAPPAAAAVGTYMFIAVRGLDGNIYINQTGDLGQSFTGWSSIT